MTRYRIKVHVCCHAKKKSINAGISGQTTYPQKSIHCCLRVTSVGNRTNLQLPRPLVCRQPSAKHDGISSNKKFNIYTRTVCFHTTGAWYGRELEAQPMKNGGVAYAVPRSNMFCKRWRRAISTGLVADCRWRVVYQQSGCVSHRLPPIRCIPVSWIKSSY